MIYKIKKTATLLETFLEIYQGMSKQKAKSLISYSTIKYNDKVLKKNPTIIVEKDGKLEIVQNEKNLKINKTPTRQNPIAIYYEDKYLIIAIKPVGILTCNSGDDSAQNFHKMLEAYLSDRDDTKIRLWIVHRIDREVEGLIIFAKNEEIQNLLKDNWQEVTKKYLALTEAKPPFMSGVIENWLKDTESQKVEQYNKEVTGSKLAKSEYKYLKPVNGYHLVEIMLHTGRKNQIRVHLSGIGCPIVGDRKYGADDTYVRKIRLVAFSLEFLHPITKKMVNLEYKPTPFFYKPSVKSDEKYK